VAGLVITFAQLDPSAHAPCTSRMLVAPRPGFFCSLAPVVVVAASNAIATAAANRPPNFFERLMFIP